MHRFEYCNANTCAQELLALGQVNMKMWYLFQWLTQHGQLQHGTQAEMLKLYVNEKLVAYSLLENYEARTDKAKWYAGQSYQNLGVVHFVTMPEYRKKGYASLVADMMYKNVIRNYSGSSTLKISGNRPLNNNSRAELAETDCFLQVDR